MREPVFSFEFDGEETLSVEQIWPDGDAPENPTVEDVIARVKEDQWSVTQFSNDWNLGVSLLINGKDSGLR